MRVVYKTSMVDKIILTPDEWQDLRKELRRCPYICSTSPDDRYSLGLCGAVAKFKGIPIFVDEENGK